MTQPTPTMTIPMQNELEAILATDPLKLTADDLNLLINHYRVKRLQFDAVEAKPKTIDTVREKLSAEASAAASREAMQRLLGMPIGGVDQ